MLEFTTTNMMVKVQQGCRRIVQSSKWKTWTTSPPISGLFLLDAQRTWCTVLSLNLQSVQLCRAEKGRCGASTWCCTEYKLQSIMLPLSSYETDCWTLLDWRTPGFGRLNSKMCGSETKARKTWLSEKMSMWNAMREISCSVFCTTDCDRTVVVGEVRLKHWKTKCLALAGCVHATCTQLTGRRGRVCSPGNIFTAKD